MTIQHTWRTRVREVITALIAFAAGVVGATAGAGVPFRIVGGALFVVGAYLVVDAVVLASSWRLTNDSLKIPTLASRHRQISGGSELAVAPAGVVIGSMVVSGKQGSRTLRVNPLVSPSDLHRWFAAIAEAA